MKICLFDLKINARNSCKCGSCGLKVCLKHRFEDQHDCRPAPTCRRSAGVGNLATKLTFFRG